jgi:hypothetical protein
MSNIELKEGIILPENKIKEMIKNNEVKLIEEAPKYLIHREGYVIVRDTGLIKKTFLNVTGYKRLGLISEKHNNKYVNYTAHRLVAKYFCSKPENYESLTVNHKDGNKLNNKWTNLEWVTAKENIEHMHRIGFHSADNPIIVKDLKDNKINEYRSVNEFSKHCGIHNRHIVSAIGRPDKYPLINRYIVRLKDPINVFNKLVGKKENPIYIYDYVTGKKEKLLLKEHVAYKYGIPSDLLSDRFKKGIYEFYLGGLHISKKENFEIDNSITPEKALKDREEIWKREIGILCKGLEAYDPIRDILYEFKTSVEMKNKLNIKQQPRSILNGAVRWLKVNKPGVVEGYIVRRICDNVDVRCGLTWEEYIKSYFDIRKIPGLLKQEYLERFTELTRIFIEDVNSRICERKIKIKARTHTIKI